MKAILRETALILSALAATLLLVLLALAASIGPALNTPAVQRMALAALDSLTGLSWRADRIRFAYPFTLTVEGLSLQGRAGARRIPIRAYAQSVRVASSLQTLIHAQVDEIQVDGVDLDVAAPEHGAQQGAAGTQEGALEIPDWIWRVRRAGVRISTVGVHSSGQALCLDDLCASWVQLPPEYSGRIDISLNCRPGPSRPADLVLLVTQQSVTALSGPVVLPTVDLAPLVGFAGLDLAVTGTLSGAVFPVPGGPLGAEALYLALFAEDLSLEGKNLDAGFSNGSLQMSGLLLLPVRGAGLTVLMEEVAGSIRGLTLGGRRPGPDLDSAGLSGSFAFDTLSDNADWTMDVRDDRGNLTARTEGTLEHVLSGRHHATVSVRARCRNIATLERALPSRVPLPMGTALRGEAEATASLAGDLAESMEFNGSLKTAGLELDSGPSLRLPLRLGASFSGSLHKGGLEAFRIDTDRFEIGELTTAKASAAYGRGNMTGTVTIDSIEAKRLAPLLAPLLPEGLSGYQWEGTAGLSANAGMGTGQGSPVKGAFAVAVRNGQFSSPDYQRMGEGIDVDLRGSFQLEPGRGPVDLVLDASLAKGEIVVGDIYGNLSKTHPQLKTDLRYDRGGGTLRVRSAGIVLDGVGTAGLEGRFSRGRRGVRANTEIKTGPILLDGLLDRVLRDALGGRYPAVQSMTGAGTLAVAANLDLENGSWRARGEVAVEQAAFKDPSQNLSVERIELTQPFSLAAARGSGGPGPTKGPAVRPGTLSIEGIDFRGLEIPEVRARVLLAGNGLTLMNPLRMSLAGGSVDVGEFKLQGLGSGSPEGRATLEINGLDLAPLTKAAGWKGLEGRLSARFDEMALEAGTWKLAGRLDARIRDGEFRVEQIDIESPLSGTPRGSCTVRADRIPLEPLSSGLIHPPLKGTLEGDLPTVTLSDGRIETKGSLTLSVFGGTITLSNLGAEALFSPRPVARLDVDMKGIRLRQVTSPLKFGYISGVLQGRILGLRVRPQFPYATAFDAELETVAKRGVPRKIDATAVVNLSRIGGSNELAAILSKGLYRYFDEYYYREMGLRATLKDGWLELHGIPRGKKEYLIIHALRIPTLSMPITVMTSNHKIRFDRWLSDLIRVGQGK